MKKRLLFLALSAGLIAAAFTGCSKQQTAESTAAESSTAETSNQSDDASAKEEESAAEEQTDAEGVKPVAVRIEQVTNNAMEDNGNNASTTAAQYAYPRLYLDDEAAAEYPELAKAFEEYNSKNDADKDSVLAGLKSEYDEIKEYNTDDSSMYITETLNGRILRADSNVVSMLIDYTDFHGGAHGYYYTYGVSFDAKTGKELCLGDVVKDKDAFIKLVSDKFFEKYTKDPDYSSLTDAGEELKGYDFNSNESLLWSIDPEGVTVYFAPYTLGAYALGAQDISIYFDEAPEVFNEQYTEACADYIMPLDDYKSISIDVGSGKREAVSATLEYGDNAQYGLYQPSYSIGNLDINGAWECYSMEAYLVHSNDKYYIYSFQSSDDDAVYLSVVDLANKSMDDSRNDLLRINTYYSSDYSKPDESIWVNGKEAFTNPKSFVLATSLDAVGTYSGYRTYHVGEDGYPVSDANFYTSESQTAFVAAKDLELDTVDADSKITGKENVSAGTYLAVVRTDGTSYVDIQAVDESEIEVYGEDEWKTYHLKHSMSQIADTGKTMYRVTVDKSNYPYKANGVNEDELFSNIMYAG